MVTMLQDKRPDCVAYAEHVQEELWLNMLPVFFC